MKKIEGKGGGGRRREKEEKEKKVEEELRKRAGLGGFEIGSARTPARSGGGPCVALEGGMDGLGGGRRWAMWEGGVE